MGSIAWRIECIQARLPSTAQQRKRVKQNGWSCRRSVCPRRAPSLRQQAIGFPDVRPDCCAACRAATAAQEAAQQAGDADQSPDLDAIEGASNHRSDRGAQQRIEPPPLAFLSFFGPPRCLMQLLINCNALLVRARIPMCL